MRYFLAGDGLVHISELADYHVPSVEDVVELGEEITVVVKGKDHSGKISLSRRMLLQGESSNGGVNGRAGGACFARWRTTRVRPIRPGGIPVAAATGPTGREVEGHEGQAGPGPPTAGRRPDSAIPARGVTTWSR